MSELHDDSITIFEAINNIENGKYVMPAFQRQFVWTMSQIEKLWDSILLDYPIATFLFWKVDDSNITWDTYFCTFLTRIIFNSKKVSESENYELSTIDVSMTDTGILDGQQRLTSLYISLFGETHIRPNYARKGTKNTTVSRLLLELNENKASEDEEEYNSKKNDIKFTGKDASITPTQFEIKRILDEKFQNKDTRDKAIEDAIENVPSNSKDYARKVLNKLYSKIFEEKIIRYTEIRDMKQDDALEMFVRFNSGGRPLRKSDITMSILEAYWPSAKTEFGKILTKSYKGFSTDFLIRAALMLYGDVIKSNIDKKFAKCLRDDWNAFKKALVNLETLLKDMKIDINRFSSSWNVLLPILYYIYYDNDYESNKRSILSYLLRAIFFNYFRSVTTARLQQMKSTINNYNTKITIEMLDQMGDLHITEAKIEDLLNSEKGSRIASEVLYYLSIDWLNKTYKYEQDHLHPDDRFNETKPITVSSEVWNRWRSMRNRLPNLHLLEGRSNGSKNSMRLVDYYNDMNSEQQEKFIEQAIIPEGASLEIENFEVFYIARKELLTKKILYMLGK